MSKLMKTCIVYVKYVQLIVYQLHLNKAVNYFLGLESYNFNL